MSVWQADVDCMLCCSLCSQAPFYSAMSEVVKVGCRAAIWLSKRI